MRGGRRRRWKRAAEYLTTLVEVAIVVAALAYVATGSLGALIAWEAIGTAYLVVGFIVAVRHSSSATGAGNRTGGRSGRLDTLSWVLPLVSSLVGVQSAVLALIARGATGSTAPGRTVLALAASLGVVISWHLLHTGFAQIYESAHRRSPGEPPVSFPGTTNPSLLDFLYFAFTIGTAFATSDAKVNTSRMRRTVLVHSVLSFFYNALVVAVALQVIQQLVEA